VRRLRAGSLRIRPTRHRIRPYSKQPGVAAAEPKKPFYVSFTHDAISIKVDHSRPYPGPPGGPADRAGYTNVTSKPRFTIAWDNAPLGRDGRLPIFARSANVCFRLTDYSLVDNQCTANERAIAARRAP